MQKTYFVLLGIFFILIQLIKAQPSKDTSAPYLKQKGLPNFSILLHDSSATFNQTELQTKPIVALIYFSTTCGHCQDKATALTKIIDSLPNIFFVWVAPEHTSLVEVHEFAVKYNLDNQKNLVVGKELKYFLPTYYRMQTTPYTVIYKKNELFVEFRSDVNMQDLIEINSNQYIPQQRLENEKGKKENKKYKKPE